MAILRKKPWGDTMIKILPQPEPDSFETVVRVPGLRFLRMQPHPTSKQWAGRDYWRLSGNELREAYEHTCAYSCSYIASDTGSNSVEHYVSKDADPLLAYEWSNYRLVCGRLNGRKSNYDDVLDPFAVEDGWFVLDFPSLLVRPSDDLGIDLRTKVESTIARLKLNDDETCVHGRLVWVEAYCKGHITVEFLQKMAPFVYKELVRQDLLVQVKAIWNQS